MEKKWGDTPCATLSLHNIKTYSDGFNPQVNCRKKIMNALITF